MKFNSLLNLAFFAGQLVCQIPIISDEKPLHIGVSILFASRSHVKYLLEILEDISKRGHRITFVSMDEMKRFGNGYNLTYYSLGNEKLTISDYEGMNPFIKGDNIFTNMINVKDDLVRLYKTSFPRYEKFYIEEKPDLMICDFIANGCLDSAAKNSIPMIIGYQSLVFTYAPPFLTANGELAPTTIENFSFLQRLRHAFIDPIHQIMLAYPIVQPTLKLKEANGIPLTVTPPGFGYMGIGIANSYVGLENARNIPSHIHPIGPILSGDTPPLPEELQSFMNTHGKVLYVAFGTLVKPTQELLIKLLSHLQRALNHDILDGIIWGLPKTDFKTFPKSFKVDNTEYTTDQIVEGTHDKIKLLNWAPQQSILNHPSTKLFLSHGGLDSIYESMDAGVPMMILPFVADQPRNAMLVTENGVGDYIEWGAMSDMDIYQKFAKLLDPNNLELKAKVNQMQLITKFSSKRKAMAADLVETYAYTARSCRKFSTPKPFEAPCEVLPFLPLDKRISSIKANLIDVYIAGFLILITFLASIIYITYYSFKKLFEYFKYKPKQE